MKTRISPDWRRMAEIYKRFAPTNLDFSESAAEEAYLFESRGEGNLQSSLFSDRKPNGFAVGKKYMGVTVDMWKRDIQAGLLFRHELAEDYPRWFLDRFLGSIAQGWPLSRAETEELYQEVIC